MKKFLSMAIATTLLASASIATLPASAEQNDDYNISYETLSNGFITQDGNYIPTGSVAVTVSIDDNTGFVANTLFLNVNNGYQALTQGNNMLTIETETVLDDALISGSVSADGSTICVSIASAMPCLDDGAMFTFYLTPMLRRASTDIVSVVSSNKVAELATYEQVKISGNNGNGTRSWQIDEHIWHYVSGDADDDSEDDEHISVNAADAAYILHACQIAVNHELYVTAIDNPEEDWKYYFPSARFAQCPDANMNGIITVQDASDVLNYAVIAGAGNLSSYTGLVGTVCTKYVL